MRNIFNALEGAGRKKDFSAIKLMLAPPEKIREWSYGEVRMPETINYRTFAPERGGLFCAKIFGPMKDYECVCGKYKRLKFRGVVCEKCGVEVTLARVRRERMGHINLACPVAHILFFKALPSRIGLVLDLTMRDIERILYFEVYVVIDPGRVEGLDRGKLLKVEEYQELCDKHPRAFRAGIGAEGVRDFLKDIDLKEESQMLRDELLRAGSETRRKKIFKRLKIIENLERAGLRPEWMVLEALPVLPPDLRPLVQLEGGRFTTSDLNDLYRRVINRNNRLKRLIDLGAPEVIVNNEKRMLQEAVDSLLDNGRRGKPATGANRRPLKSVADIIKGKSGRFRQNLLGKRVDFSGRSVIIAGPELKLHQCGLPKQMALTLFRPFVFNKLMQDGHAESFKQARSMVETEHPEVWGVLAQVIAQHPVLLNRAPTLHRLGVQAFEPVLTEGKAIQLHPLVCVAFNADFDGDQMAVHVPLSLEAQAEARVLMLSSNNILHPAHGEPVIVPTQDVVLGLYYATREVADAPGRGTAFADITEVERALAAGAVTLQTPIEVRLEHDLAALTGDERPAGEENLRLVKTTAGRALLKRFLPEGLPFAMINKTIKKRELTKLIKESFWRCGHRATVIFCDQLMRFGFEKATRAGISVCMDDMRIPPEKTAIIKSTEAKIQETRRQFQNGLLTEDERYNKSVDLWDKAGEEVSRVMMKNISLEQTEDAAGGERESFNSIYMMADSGARGSETQIKQLAGMRGLMTKPDGRIMENAITANFREGLSVLQYFISTHGARKGLSDTALKTANSGYLTRRLVDVTQDIVVSEVDCGSSDGIMLRPVIKDGHEQVSLADRLAGRTLASAVKHPQSGTVAYPAGARINEADARYIAEDLGLDEVKVRSPVTCKTAFGLCAKCYGRDLGRGGEVCLGEAVGVVAAQSIGEPGTQLTMRTFHIGGAASREVVADNINARNGGSLRLHGVRYVTNTEGELVVVSRGGEMSVQEESGRERERYRLQYGQVLKFKDGDKVKQGQLLSLRDPMSRPIVAEYEGEAKLENIEMGVNAREQTDENTGIPLTIITENKQGAKKAKQPQMKFTGAGGEEVQIRGTDTPVTIALLPGSILSPKIRSGDKMDGGKIRIGDVVAKIPQRAAKSRDITGGLPRVAELFEAREPKEPAILANSSGRVVLLGLQRTKQVLAIADDGKKESYDIPPHYKLHSKDGAVKRGDFIAEGKFAAGLSGALSVKRRAEVATDDGKKESHDIPPHYKLQAKGGAVKRGDVIAETAEGEKIAAGLSGALSVKKWAEVAGEGGEIESHEIPLNSKLSAKEGAALKSGDEVGVNVAAGLSGLLSVHTADSSGEEKPAGSDPRFQLLDLCRPEKIPQHLRDWAKPLSETLENFSGTPDELRKIVGKAEKDLGKIASGQGGGVTPRKMGEWLRQFRRRSQPDEFKSESAELQQWARETLSELDAAHALKTEGGLSSEELIQTVSAAGKRLDALAKSESAKMKRDSWQKRIAEVEGDARALTASVGKDADAVRRESDLLEKVKIVSGNMRTRKVSAEGKEVEITAAKFHNVPKGRAILVQDGSFINKGEEIVDGDSNPHEILAMRGVEALVEHIVNEVQDVYRLQGVNINDKHIEVIIHQMLRCVRVTDPGDSHLIPDDNVMRNVITKTNAELEKAGKKPAKFRAVLMGITKASLATDSFISAASFQETSRVLTEAAVAGDSDFLRGLKENVIVGRLVPTGTGFVHYQKAKERDAELQAQQLLRDELEATEGAASSDSEDAPPPSSAVADG